MTSKRIAQTNQQQKSENPQESGILQRAAVRSVSDAGMQSTDDKEALTLSNSVFSKDFSRVPISTTKPQPIMAKQMLSPVVQQKNTPTTVQSGEGEAIQRQDMSEVSSDRIAASVMQPENKTGLPDKLKAGIENLSGISMDDVKVHYNSDKPAQLQAHAYAQRTDIHVASGQEKHLPHEAWHVVQQKQGRVKPTMQMKGKVNINDDAGLEKEADVMGAKAFQFVGNRPEAMVQRKLKYISAYNPRVKLLQQSINPTLNRQVDIVQRVIIGETDITSNTDVEIINKALDWSKFGGIKTTLTKEQIEALVKELDEHKDCEEIVEELQEKLESDSETNSEYDAKSESEAETEEDFNYKNFPPNKGEYKLIGVHETTSKSIDSLVANGVSSEKMGTGNGLGKGKGFYVLPVYNSNLKKSTEGIRWGTRFVAVYIHNSCKMMSAPEGYNMEKLEEEFGGKNNYYEFGKLEHIIPESLFRSVKLARKPTDTAHF